MSEIMHDKSMSVATMMGMMVILILAIIPPILVEKYGENAVSYLFMLGGFLTIFSNIFIYFFMYETKGKSQVEI